MTSQEELQQIKDHHTVGVQSGALYWNNNFDRAREVLRPIMETPRGLLEEACLSLAEDMLKGTDKSKLIAKFQAAGEMAERSIEPKQSLYKKISGIFKSNNRMIKLQTLEYKLIMADSLLDASLGQLETGSYISGCLGLRKAWHCYNQVRELCTQYKDDIPQCIIDGYKFGLGAFHLCLSVLPHSAIVVLRIAGIDIQPTKGIKYLTTVVAGKGIRYPVASLMLLAFYLCSPSGYIPPKLEDAGTILKDTVVDFPNNRTFLVFDAYRHRKKGDLDKALEVVASVSGGGGCAADNIPLFLKAEFLFAMFNFKDCLQTIESLLGSEHVDSSFAHYQQLLFMLSSCCYLTGDAPKGDRILATVSSDSIYKRAMQNRSGAYSKTGMYLSPILYMVLNRDINHLCADSGKEIVRYLEGQAERIDVNEGFCSCLTSLARGIIERDLNKLESALSCKKQFPVLAAAAAYELGSICFQSRQYSSSKHYLHTASKIDFKFDSLSKRISVATEQVTAML